MLAGQVTIIHRDYVSLPLLQVGSVRASDAATLAPRKAKGDQPGAKQRGSRQVWEPPIHS